MKDHKHRLLLGHNKMYMRILAFLLAFVLVFTNTNFTVVAENDNDTLDLDIGEPDGGNPDDGNPDDGNPDDGNPDDGKPDNGNPDDGNPDNGNPDDGNPDDGNPDDGNPDDGNPDDGNPDDGNPDDGNPDPPPASADDEENEEDEEDNTLDSLIKDSKIRTKSLLGAGNLLGAQNEDNTEYYLYANGNPLSSSDWYDISYTESVSFTAKVVGDTEETYSSGVAVYYASSVGGLTPGNSWSGTPEVGEYYVTFAVPDAYVDASASGAYYMIRVNDSIPPVITHYSTNGNEISITASDDGSGILAYSLSTSDSNPADWTNFENAATVPVDSLDSGVYYLYVKDASGNTTRSESAISVTWLIVEKFYKDGAMTTYRGVTTANSLSLPAPDSRSKFDFAGFYESEDYSGSAHSAGEISLVSGQDNVFYGKWTLKGIEFAQDLDASYQKTYDGADLNLSVALSDTYDSLSWTWYRADAQDGSYSAVSGGAAGTLTLKNVDDSGYYKAVATITEEGEQSSAESQIAHVEIQKKDLSVTIDDKTISYLSPVPEYTIQATGFAEGDSLESVFGDYSSSLSCEYRNDSEVRTGAGTYPINAGNLSADNYNLTVTSGTLTVTPLAVTESDTVNVTLSEGPFVYTGSPIEPGVTSVGITLSSDPSSGEMILSESDYDVSYQNNVNVGTNAKVIITFKGNLSGEYAGTTFEISKGTYPVKTFINHSSWKYGERPADLSVGVDDTRGGTITYYYLAAGNEESFDAADQSGASTSVPVNAGRYYVWAEISETENYGAITAAPAIFDITKRQITLTSATKTWPYDGNSHTSGDYTQTGDGFVEGEGFHSVTVSGSVRTVDESPVTNDIAYVLTTATKEANYEITLEKGTLSITKAPLPTITSLRWGTSPGDLRWVAITRDGLNIKYELQIYKDGALLGEPILTTDTEYNIKDIIINDSIANGIGGYSATITARIDVDPAGMYNNYTEGTESAQIANKYTAKLGLVKNGGDVGVDSFSFTDPVHGESDPDTIAYLLQGESIRANVTYVNGYENDDENTVFNYRTGSEGLSKGGYTQGGYYTVSFTNSSISSAVDADVAVKSKDSAPICEQFSAAQAADYSYVRASISIKDALGLYGYKIVNSVDSITDDDWTPIPHDELDVPKKQFTTTKDFTAAGNYYLVFKDIGNNIRYCETPVTVYKLTFDKNDAAAQGTMDPIYKLKDNTVVLPPNAFTKAGFVFTNWTVGSSILPDGASYVKNESATLKAGWTDRKFSYKVNYFHQQFEISGDEIVLSYPATPDSTAEFSCAYNAEVRYDDAALQQDREGYILTGTPTLPEGSAEYVPAMNVTTDGLELNIYYNLVKYTMTYTYTDYDNSVKTLVDEYYYGQEFIEKEKPTRTGYSFIGWNYGDSGQAPVTMPANNLSATGHFKANSASYIIRYYFQNVDRENAEGNYLGSRFEQDSTIQGDETIAADYGKEINAYVGSGSDDLNKEIVVARNITGFEPKAVIVSYGTSEAKTFDSLAELNAFADDASYDSDLTHNVFSEIEGEVPEGVQNGPTIVSFYYTRNTYNLSMHVYLGNRDDNKPLFGATYPDDKASWTFPYGYVFPASGDFSPEWFETYGYDSEGIIEYPNGKKHSKAWTKRWSTFETQVTADKYYLANFVDWSSGSRPQSMPAGNVTVVREYASREQSMYRIELYVEQVKEVSHTFGGASYTSFDPGYYELETSFERYIEPGRVVSIVESGEGTETEIPISKLIDSVDSKQYYEHVSVSGEVLEATVLENMYEEDNITIKPESISVLKVYMSRKSYPITVNYYERAYGDQGHTDTSLASYTINQKWGTSYFIDSLYYYAGETAAVPTGDNSSNSKASTFIGNVTESTVNSGITDFETAGYKIATYWYYQSPSSYQNMGSAGGHSDYNQYADRATALSNRFNKVRVGTGTGDNASRARVYYLKPVTDKHYYVKLTYRKYENGEPKNDAYLIHSEDGVAYQICVANKSDVFVSNAEGAALRSEFEAVNVTYTTSQYETNPGTQVSGTFYRLKNDTHSTKLLFTVVNDDRFSVGNLASFTYNSAVSAHIGRETFDSPDNNPNERFGTPKRYAHGSEILASTGSANPILGVNGSTADHCVDQLSYYFDFDKDFSITYIYDGKSRRVDYGAIVDVPKSEVGYDRDGDEVFDPGEGYEIVWYTDSTFTSVVSEDIHVNKGIMIYGKRFNKSIENFDIVYYQMPDTTSYYTGDLAGLNAESEDIEIEYQYDEHTIVTKIGTYTKYYSDSSDRVLYAAKKSHFVKAFSEFSMDYASYVTEGFEHDDKNTKNVLSGFCGSKPINLRSYYSRTSALLTIRRNDSDTTANDETAIKVNASTIRVDDPVKIGYTFTGWKLYNYTGGVKVSDLNLDAYGYIHNDVTEHHAGYAQFSMPICDTLLEAQWNPKLIDFEIVHMFQDNNKVYQQDLLDKTRRGESTDIPVVTVTDAQELITYYYMNSVSDNNLFAAVETLEDVKSEDVIAVNVHDLSSSTVSFANGTYQHNAQDSKQLDKQDNNEFKAYYDATVIFYYERDSSIVISTKAYCLDASGDTGLTLSGAGSYYYGQQVNLFAVMQPTGYEFKGWFKVNSGEDLTEEQAADLRTLIADADNEGSVLTTVSSLTQHAFSATGSGFYIAVTDASAAIKPTITITITRDLDHNPLYYNYAPDAENQFNASINWGEGVDAGANNIKKYTWYYCSFEDMSQEEYEALDPETLDLSNMTPIENSNTSTFNLPTGYEAGYYVLRCVADIERKDNGRTEVAQGSYKFAVLPNEAYLETVPLVGQKYTGNTYSYTERWHYTPSDYSIYYSKEPFTIGEDVSARIALPEGDSGKVYETKPGYKDVIVDGSHAPTPHVVYYYVVSRDANYASVKGSETIEILPVPVTVTAVKPFTKIYDGTEQILGKPDGEVGTVTYKYTAEEGIYSDYYRLQSGIESPGAARSPYYKINGILSADTGKTMMLNFDASFDYMHAGGSGREEGTLVTLTNLWVITEDELHSVYENWNYVFPNGETLQLSGQIKPYPLDIKWLPASDSDVDGTYSVDDFSYNYTGSPIAPYIKIVGNTQRIPDSAENFSVAVKNKQTNAGTYSAIPEVEAVEGARYFPTDYTFTLENQTYKILPRYIKVYPKNVTKVYNATNQTMLDSEDEFRFETKETAGGQYTAYDLPATEHYNALASASYKNAGVYSNIAAKNLSVYTLDEQGRKNVITDNYVIEYGQGTLTIDKCPVVISGITGVNKEYDGTTAADLNIEAATIRLASDGTSPIYAGDSLTLEKIGMPGTFSDEFVANNKLVTISYTDPGSEVRGIAFKEEGSYNNYVIDVQGSQPTTTANIIKDGKVTVVVKAGDVEIIYGETVTGAHFEYEIHGLHGDDNISEFTIETGYPQFMLMKKVGESFVNVRGDGVSFEGTDNLDFIKELDVGTYYIFFVEKTGGENDGHHFVKGFNSPKYNVSWDYEHPATITILQRPISVTGVSTAPAVTKVYDGTVAVSDENKTLVLGEQTSHGYYTFGDVADEDESGVLPRDAGKLVLSEIAAEYNDKNVEFATKVLATEAVLGGDAAANYTLVNNEFEVPGAITPKDLTVKVNNQTVTYGSAPAAYGFTIEGAVPADEEVILAGLKDSARTKVNCRYEAVAAPSAGNSHDVGYYAMNVDGTQHYSNPNYNISFPVAGGNVGETFGLLSVTRKDLTYVAKDVFISYGVQNPPTIFDGEFVSTDFVYGDTIKTEKVEEQTAKIISDTTGSNIAVYTDDGCTTDAGTWEVSFISAAENDSLPGDYTVTPGNVASAEGGLFTRNYNIKAASGTLTIKKFYILVSGVTVGDKIYDGTTAVGADKIDITTATFKYYVGATANTKTYDQLPTEFKSSFDTNDFTAAYTSKDVGSNIPVSLQIKIKERSALERRYMLLTADNKSDASQYDTAHIFGSDVTQTSATSTIYAKDLLLKPKDFEKTYGEAVSADNVTLIADGFVGEENLVNIPGFSKAYTFTPAYTAGSDTGSYTVDISTSAPGSGVHGNYNISFDTGTMTVKKVKFPAPEEVTWNAGRLSWNPVAQIGNVSPAGYKLVLKKAGETVHTVDLCEAAEFDFSNIIRLSGSGIYTVDICAVADTDNNETYKNVEQFGDEETSATKKAVLVTPKYSEDEVTQKAIDAQADKKLYVTAGDYCDSYVVIAGESTGVSALFMWAGVGTDSEVYRSGYEIDSFTSSTEAGVTLTTVMDKSAQGEFNGNAVISDDITATSINLILKLKKRPAQGTLTITSDANSAPYGALTHPAYTAVPAPTENVEYSYSYNWYYKLGYITYDSTNAGKDTVRTIDEQGNVVVQENDIVWNNNQFTFPRGKRAQAYDVYCEVTATRKDNGESVPLTANKTFTITKPTDGDPSYLILTASSWDYGASRVPATCIPLFGPEMGEVTILYRAKGQGESAWNAAVPTEAGTYEVCARSAGTDSYPSVTSEIKEITVNKRTLAVPGNFIMAPDGNGNPYGLLKWDAVTGFRENAGVSPASEVTVTYEVEVLYTRNINGTISEADVIATRVTSETELDVINYINEDGGYFFRIRALANERTEEQGNNNCNDSDYTYINTPLIGAKITTDIEGNTKEYDGAPVTITAGYSDSSSNYEFKWYKDGAQITGASQRDYQFTEVGESGLYSVEVRSDNTDGKWISSKVIRVSVTPRPVTITAASDSKVYDNTPLSHSGTYSGDALRADMYSIAYNGSYTGAEPLVEGEAITGLTFSGTITDAGTQNNTPSAVVIKKGNALMSGNYVVTYMSGTLTVSKKAAKIIAPSDTKVYDGTPLTAPGIGEGVPADKKAVATGLVSGHQLSDLSMTQDSTITNVGQHANSADLGSVVIIDTNDGSRDVSANYEFTKEDGVLTVTKAPAYIEAADRTVTYDGTSKTVTATMKGDHDGEVFKNAELRYALENTPDNDSLLLSFIHAGEYRIRITLAESDNHLAAEPVVVTLKINPRALSIKAVTKSKEYDATPHALQDSEYSVVAGTFAEGDAIDSVDVYNDAVKVKVGETESSHVRNAVIKNAAGAVVSSDYQITYLDGELSFTRRDITIKAKDHSKTYDGAALELSGPIDTTAMSDADNDYYVVSAGSLAGSDTVAEITVTGSRTECGSSDAVASDAVIKHGDEDVTGCYNISYENGSITINKRSITVTAKDQTKVYDGSAMTFAGAYTDESLFTVTGDGIMQGDSIESVILTGSQLTVGESALVPSGLVIKNGASDRTGNYDISYVNGKIRVTAAGLVIRAKELLREYNGQPFTYENATLTEKKNLITVEGLLEGDSITGITLTGSITNAGEKALVPGAVRIVRGDTDVSSSYDVSYVNGKLTVTPIPLTVEASDKESMYGESLQEFIYTITDGSEISEGDAEIRLDTEASSSAPAGTYTITPRCPNGNYLITPVVGTYTITARPITITADSANADYVPGIELTKDTYKLTAGTLAAGDEIASVTMTGKQTTVGSGSNVASNAVIKKGASDVSTSYDITYVDGLLTVGKGTQEIISEDLVLEYDGNRHTFDELQKSLKYSDGGVIGIIPADAGLTSAGEIEATLIAPENDLYKEATKTARIKITKRKLAITADSASKTYDGKPLTKESWSITEGSLAAGEKIAENSITVKANNAAGSITEAGEVVNKISGNARIMRGSSDVSANYEVTYADGKLVIEPVREEGGSSDAGSSGSSSDSGSSSSSSASPAAAATGSQSTIVPQDQSTQTPEKSADIAENTEDAQEDVRSLIDDESDVVEDEEELAEDVVTSDEEDMLDITRFIVGTRHDDDGTDEILAEEGADERNLIDCEVVNADIARMITELLTEEEQKAVKESADLRFRVQVMRDDDRLTDPVRESVEGVMPSDYKIIGAFDTSLYVKIGGMPERRIEEDYSSVEVQVTIPDELWDDSMAGKSMILRTYVDENGQTVTEVAVDKVMSQSFTMSADNYSSYTLASEVAGVKRARDICFIHWLILLMMLLSILAILIHYLRRRKREEEEGADTSVASKTSGSSENSEDDKDDKRALYLALVLFNVIGAILVLFGSCKYDLWAEIASVVVSVLLEVIMSRRNKKDE